MEQSAAWWNYGCSCWLNNQFTWFDSDTRAHHEFWKGDIIPIEMPDTVTVLIEDLPTFRAKLGKSRDNIALKITEKIPRPNVGEVLNSSY